MYLLPVLLIIPYFIILLYSYYFLLKAEGFHSVTEPSVFVSIVVACRNEQDNLPNLLRCLASQNYPAHLYEVVIVNDNSTDTTGQVISGFKEIRNFYSFDNLGEGKKQALRTGIGHAGGELIITIDADCSMPHNWIRTIAACYEYCRADLMICPVQLERTGGIFGRFREMEFLSLQGVTAAFALANIPIMCNGANLAFRKDRYLANADKIHDDLDSGDDVFLLHSIKKESHSLIVWLESPDAIVITKSPTAPGQYLQQRSRWISKVKAYTDKQTIITGISTFTAVILQISFLIGSIINHNLLLPFSLVFILKSIPDFLIIRNTCRRYNRSGLIWWFIPFQICYPVYVMAVVLYQALRRKEKAF